MKIKTMIQTHDGKLHESQKDAFKHLDELMGSIITTLAHRAIRAGKYSKITDWLETEIDNFRALVRIDDDRRELLGDDEN